MTTNFKPRLGRDWLRGFLIVFVVGCGASVQVATSAETETVRQVFACNLKDGADMDDIMAARDVLVDVTNSIEGVDNVPAFIWTPFKGNFTWDMLWFDNFENLNAWGAAVDTMAAAPAASRIDAAFAPLVDCDSNLSLRETIYEGGEPMQGNGQALIASSACRLTPGKNINDVRAVLDTVRSTLDELGTHKSFIGYMGVPLTNSSDMDLYFYGVHPDASTYSSRYTAIQTSSAGQAMGAEFNEVLNCQNSLWWGQAVVTPGQ